MEFVKYIFFVYGAVILIQILLTGTPIRHIKPFKCSACLGFWVGFFSYELFLPIEGWMNRLAMAIAAAGTSWLLDGIVKGER